MAKAGMTEGVAASEWAGRMGEKWLAHIDGFEGMIAEVGAALMRHGAFAAGERVVDIGCGGGATAIAIGRAVGPTGAVLGLDISPALIAKAEQRAAAAGANNIRLRCADAATARVDGPFDRLFSRFGMMFFQDFAGAFANLRAMLRDGGRLDMSVWAPASENGWIIDMQGILAKHVELPKPEPNAPGPFALQDPDFVRSLLEAAGFHAVNFELWRGEQLVGGAGANPETAADFVLNAMSFIDALKDKPAAVQGQVRHELIALFAAHYRDGAVRMPAGAWFVTAKT